MLPNASPGSVLIVEDDATIRDFLCGIFSAERYDARTASTIGEGRALLLERPFDLLVLDLSLPDGDGIAFCRELRGTGHYLQIIMLTARTGPVDRVLGLELGADDYLAKPFEPRELLVRARKRLEQRTARSVRSDAGFEPRIMRFATWELDCLHRRLIAANGRLIALPASEFRLLRRFLDAPGRIMSREALLPERKGTVAFDRSLDIQVSRLRQRLGLDPKGAELILTIRGEGYMLAAEVDRL